MADPRLAARRRAAKFTSDSDDLVIGRNAVLEALRLSLIHIFQDMFEAGDITRAQARTLRRNVYVMSVDADASI